MPIGCRPVSGRRSGSAALRSGRLPDGRGSFAPPSTAGRRRRRCVRRSPSWTWGGGRVRIAGRPFASPLRRPPTAHVTLQVLEGLERGRTFRDLPVPFTIGREEENVVRLNDERVSRFHAKVQGDGERVILT
ncbi:MAG: FHA domain-containing protein, partial [Planctomycetota bacterium]